MPDANDMDLVREYARHNSEPAFAELVQRHIALVYSVALRFTRNPPDAQDVAQAVFVILARKAAGLRAATILTGWLYETTRLTALQWVRNQSRRRHREQEAHMESTLDKTNGDSVWRQVEPLLEQAMTRLNPKDRTLLALRFLENRSGAETAAILGIGEWAARKRADRALEKLRDFFARRGVDSTTTAIAESISANSIQAAPVALAKTISAVALAKGATASTSTLTLIKGALKIMAWTKAKTAVVTGAVLLLATGTTTVIVTRHLLAKPAFIPVATEQSFSAENIQQINAGKQWGLAFMIYANDHGNQFPQKLDSTQMGRYAGGLSDTNWEVVSSGRINQIARPASTILLREKEARRGPDGTFSKVYVFADGHVELVSCRDNDFTAVEKQRGFRAVPGPH